MSLHFTQDGTEYTGIPCFFTDKSYQHVKKWRMGLKAERIGFELGGRYRLERLLGQGGMSAVYLATDLRLRRPVAVKMIHEHLADDSDFQRRFEGEATGIARLRHPGIIQVYDFNHEEKTWYMVMEYIEGWTLEAYREALAADGQRLSVDQTITLISAICRAVDYAHQQGIIHRDIKPANIMIRPTGSPVLMDFGIAKMVLSSEKTATGFVLGTVSYMAPEQIKGDPIDHRVDIYALTILLFELLIGRRPFESDNSVATMQKHLNEPPPDLQQIDPTLPAKIAEIVAKGLAKEPADRFARANDMAAELESVQTGQRVEPLEPTLYFSSPAWPVGESTEARMDAAAHSMTVPNQTSSEAAPAISPATSQGRRWILGALLGIALLVLTVFLLPAGVRAALISPTEDRDGDGLTAWQEFQAGTDFTLADSDDDGFPDKAELAVDCLDPLNADVDGDGIIDGDDPFACEAATQDNNPQQVRIIAISVVGAADMLDATDGGDGEYADTTMEENAPEIDDGKHYHVEFETSGFVPQPRDFHIHFFYDTVTPENSGIPGDGPWEVHQATDPFEAFVVNERPAAATAICVIVANPDHTTIPTTFDCFDLPDG